MSASSMVRSDWRCPGCGREVAGDTSTCPTCHFALTQQRWDYLTAPRMPGTPIPTRARPLWKTLTGAAIIMYSPLLAALAAVVLFAGTTTPNDIVRVVLGAGGTVVFAVAVFLYLFAYGIAVVYVDRRIHPASYSFWRAVGSTALMYFAVLLPLAIVVLVVMLVWIF
jgi:hypothetical protein